MDYETLFEIYGYVEGNVGKNYRDEDVYIAIDDVSALVRTYLLNGQIHNQVYYKDGRFEESFE